MDASAFAVWFLVACIVAALICIAVGAVGAMRALQRVKKHAQAIIPQPLIAKANAAKDAAERLQGTLTLIEALIPRAGAALETSFLALREIRSAFAFRR
jgi:hypothetical protein